MVLLPIKSPRCQTGTQHSQHHGTNCFPSSAGYLLVSTHPPPAHSWSPSSLLKPESHILPNTLLINTVWLNFSFQWVTLNWSFTDHSLTFPVFPILWKDLHKCQNYLRMTQFSFIVYFWYLTNWHILKPGRERQDVQALKSNWNIYFKDCFLGHHASCCIFSYPVSATPRIRRISSQAGSLLSALCRRLNKQTCDFMHKSMGI